MKKYVALFAVISVVALSGCSAENINDKGYALVKQYLLSDNDQYNEYLSKKEINEENIDADGYYIDSEITQLELSHTGIVHVSFASNSLLNVTYYADKEHKEAIDKDNCYLDPGETLYAVVDQTSLTQSNTYAFQGFSMVAFDGDQAIFDYARFDNEEITIPADIQYREVSIIPDGAYQKRDLTFSAEYKDVDGNSISLSPVWNVNIGNESFYTKSENYSIESNSEFRVTAQFDPKEYYLIEDEVEPEFETYSEETGKVTFLQYDAKNSIDNYKLVLGKKFDIEIDSVSATGPITIWIDGTKQETSFPLKTSARLGAEVRIESENKITKVGNTQNLFRLTNNGYVYTVYNETDIFEFDPTEYTYANGKVIFYDIDKNEITEKTNLNIGDIIHYVGKPDEGYVFSMKDGFNKIRVDSNIDYILKNELKFTGKREFQLAQPENGGTITYYLNGNEVKDEKSILLTERIN